MNADKLARIEWKDKLNLDMEAIDRQHRRIVDCYNRLAEIREGVDPSGDSADRVMGALVEYARSHFEFEETLMESLGYAYLKAHTQDLLLKQLEELVERLAAREEETAALGGMVENSPDRHIEGEDQAAADRRALVRELPPGFVSRMLH